MKTESIRRRVRGDLERDEPADERRDRQLASGARTSLRRRVDARTGCTRARRPRGARSGRRRSPPGPRRGSPRPCERVRRSGSAPPMRAARRRGRCRPGSPPRRPRRRRSAWSRAPRSSRGCRPRRRRAACRWRCRRRGCACRWRPPRAARSRARSAARRSSCERMTRRCEPGLSRCSTTVSRRCRLARHGDERDPAAVGRDRRRAADAEAARVLALVRGDVHDRVGGAGLLDVDELGLRRGRHEGGEQQGSEDHGRAHAHQNTFDGERFRPALSRPARRPVLASAGRHRASKRRAAMAATDVGTMKNFIDGEWVDPSGGTDTVFNPATGEELAQAPVSSAGGRRPRRQGGVRRLRGLVEHDARRARARAASASPTRSRSTARRSPRSRSPTPASPPPPSRATSCR